MSESSGNPFWRFLVGVGRFINFANHLVFNLIMLLFLFLVFGLIVIAAAAKSGTGAISPVQEKTALVIDLDATLVEQYTSAPIQRAIAQATGGDPAIEIQLRDVVQALKLAKDDPKIERVVLLTDGFQVAGFASMRELGAALRDFRSGGKKILAYGAGMEQKGYYLAAQADEVFLDPDGAVLLEGLGRYRLYYRQALQDKLGVDVKLFRVGEYKSAAEPYILDAASPESKEADLFWMSDLWQRHVADIASARKLKVEDLNAMIANLPERVQAARGDLAKLAVDNKLVDGLKTQDELEKLLAARGAYDKDEHSFRQVGMYPYLVQRKARSGLLDRHGEVAVVVAQGEITDGDQPQGVVGGESTSRLIRQAREDKEVKALVLRVDSPGGGVYPSEQIRREIELTRKAGKPVVVSMANVAASGGYWISMNADRIYADPSTITGSIGIFGLWMSAPRALDKIGVHSDGIGTTPLAGAFDITRPLDPGAGTLIQSVIDHGYAQFIGKVAVARGSAPSKIDEVARGRVWSGAQAKERGLVDALGGLAEAQAEAAKLAKLGATYDVQYVEKPLSAFEQVFLDMSRSTRLSVLVRNFGPLPSVLGSETAERLQGELAWLQPRKGASPIRAVAHCLCDF
ncbi:MAG: signal peptide peptidase SppA [Gammaproteobacteria bacterium RIFCSPHIGHO2_12_FULL_63_22]|nr:MAG: signal peptide peptidase SppA [Gammaproteobacteria bacterium RIFCSPHIGHO2_12_FULL_63_22]